MERRIDQPARAPEPVALEPDRGEAKAAGRRRIDRIWILDGDHAYGEANLARLRRSGRWSPARHPCSCRPARPPLRCVPWSRKQGSGNDTKHSVRHSSRARARGWLAWRRPPPSSTLDPAQPKGSGSAATLSAAAAGIIAENHSCACPSRFCYISSDLMR